MSEYQARKARALELQREKEEEVRRELAAKAARDKQLAREEEDRRKRQEAAAKEARRLELMRANEALNNKAGGEQKKGPLDYDPFAEDERPKTVVKPVQTLSKQTTLRAPASNGAVRIASSKQSHPGPSAKASSSTKSKDKDLEIPLGRKERAAKAFAQQAKRSAGDSLFSVRALVESRDPHLPAPGPSKVSSRSAILDKSGIAIHGIGMANGLKRETKLPPTNGKGKGSVRDQLKAQFSSENLRKLCPDRATRDRRSIEEIQRDIKAKRGGIAESGRPEERARDKASPQKRRSPDKDARPLASGKVPSRRDQDIRPRPAASGTPRKRRPSTSSESSASSPPPKRRYDPYRNSPPSRLNNRSSQFDVSAEIQAMFRRPGRPAARYVDEMSDGSSDMEAGLSDVEVEERRAARIARKEDELAEREERLRKEAKEKRKKEMMRGR
ncbi:hypothetical protein IAU60_004029 [Kwoniella sp. DSM 27419]